MDEIQRKFFEIIKKYPECIRSKATLRGLLCDNFSGKKREINLITNAYEISIVDRLKKSSDFRLAIDAIKGDLLNDYSLTDEAATWAIVSWCIFLNLQDAEKYASTLYNSSTQKKDDYRGDGQKHTNAKEYFISVGCKVVDKRASGGCLWVVGSEAAIKKYVDEAARLYKVNGSYCGGGRATSYKPGWYTKDSG